jgi:peptide deformylase
MLLPLVIYPDPRLKTRSTPVETVNEEIRALAENMLETMYHERGVGLAAVQVGVLKRLLVADVEWKEEVDGAYAKGKQWVLVNPEIVDDSEELNTHKEGCLSFPDQSADVTRPKTVRVRFLDLEGKEREEEFEGLLATCVQHEIDHLNGIVFPDRVSPVKRDIIVRKAKKIKKAIEEHAHEHVHDEHCNHG